MHAWARLDARSELQRGSLGRRPQPELSSLIGNQGMNRLRSEPHPTGRGMPPEVAALLATSPTSPPRVGKPEELAAVEDGHALTNPPVSGGSSTSTTPSTPAVAMQEPDKLTVKGSGAIEGKFGISKYWPGVTKYWGTDKSLGKFDKKVAKSTWRMIGHKFQVVGKFTNGTTTTGTGGEVQFLQEARLTTTKGGTAGAWFNDMDYTDAGGGVHQWDPNAEAGTTGATGYTGVRKTIKKDKHAYTDPPAMAYEPGVTNDYRKLEFKIHLKPPPGSGKAEIIKYATQEIEIVKGKPKVLQAP